MPEETRNQLNEDDFLFVEGDQLQESSGLNRDWPDGRGIFHNSAKTLLVWVNEEDHVRVISMEAGADIKSVFARLCLAADEIEKAAEYARDPNLGYLTCCPSNIGTGLSSTIQVNLPVLADRMDELHTIASKYHLNIRVIPV